MEVFDFRSESERIETTLGELIFAISEAARETAIDDEHANKLTHAVLEAMLRRRDARQANR